MLADRERILAAARGARRKAMHRAPRLGAGFLTLVVLLGAVAATAHDAGGGSAGEPEPPLQPRSGPGGSAARYDGLLAQHFGPDPDGAAAPTGYWLFEPIRPRPGVPPLAESRLPVVLFVHAFRGGDPEVYHAWIAHLVRRGAIVVYPDYQSSDPAAGTTIAKVGQAGPALIRAAVRAALAELAAGDHVRPDLSRVAVVGHSLGAALAAGYAAGAPEAGLPVPAALMLMMPACRACDFSALAAIPPTTRVLVLVGDESDEDVAKTVWARLRAVPLDQRDYVRLISDAHGDPALVADHALPATGLGAPVDALDWYGTWKLLDALMACAFDGRWCAYALGNTPKQRFMGIWGDGVPAAEAEVTDDPGSPPAP